MTIEKPVDEQAVIDYYFYPHTLKNTLAYFHIGELRLREIVEKHGLKMRTCGQLNKKYSYDKDFFTKQSSNLAYFLGLMGSDGCIKDTGHTITFQIDGSNFNLLNYIKNYLESKLNIKVNILTRKPDSYNHIIPLYRLYCYGENARTVFKFIYQNPMDLFLNRKYNKYLLMTQEKGK